MSHPTASSLSRLDHCQWWARPEVEAPPEGPVHHKTRRGTFVHAMIEAYFSGVFPRPVTPTIPYADTETVKRDAAVLFEKWHEWWKDWGGRDAAWETEVPLALVPGGNGRRIKSSGHRDYSDRKRGEIVGTVDAMLFEETPEDIGHGLDMVTVIDWKTGAIEYIEPAQTNRQLGFLALAAARTTGAQIAKALVVHIAEDGITVDSAHFDAYDLDRIDAWLVERLAMIPDSKPQPGDHCEYCPVRSVCPAFMSAAAEMAESSALAAVARPGDITVDQIAKAWPQIRLLEAGLEQIKERVRACVEDHGSVPLLNGKHLRMVETKRENLSAASIKRAMGDGSADMLARLREAGAIETSAVKSMREVKP